MLRIIQLFKPTFISISDQNTKRESGKKVQFGNIEAGKVNMLLLVGGRHDGSGRFHNFFEKKKKCLRSLCAMTMFKPLVNNPSKKRRQRYCTINCKIRGGCACAHCAASCFSGTNF